MEKKEEKDKTMNQKDVNDIKSLLKKILVVAIVIASLISVLVLILLINPNLTTYSSSGGTNNGNGTENNNGTGNQNYDVSMFKEISAKNIESESKGKTVVIYIGRSTCSWCIEFLPHLQKAQDEFKYKTLYIDIAKIIDFSTGAVIDSESQDIITKLKTNTGLETYMEQNFGATPMVLIVKDNTIIDTNTGYVEYEPFKTIIDKHF